MGGNLRTGLRFVLWILSIMMVLSSSMPLEGAPADTGLITSFSPTGNVGNNVTFIVSFAEPVAPWEKVDEALSGEDFPFTVTPSIQAEGKWLDQSTFLASLLAPLNMGTKYTVSIKEDFKTLNGKSIGSGTYSFQTAAPSLLAAQATVTSDREVNVRLDFNMPVFPNRLRGFLSITDVRGRQLEYRITGGVSTTANATVYTRAENLPNSQLNVRIAAGLTGERGNLVLERDEVRTLDVKSVLRITGLEARSDGNIRLETSFSIDPQAAADFISVEPKTPFTLQSYYGSTFFIQGDFKPRERFVLTFKKGLPSSQRGIALEEDYVQALIMPDLDSSIEFPSTGGMYLSPAAGGKIPVELTNLHKLKIDMWRLYENNIPYVMRGEYTYFQRDLARRVYSRQINLSLPLNERVRRSISLEDLLSGDNGPSNRGLFMLTLSNPDSEWWDEASKVVNLSDMGVVARLWEDGVLVWVNTLSGLEPVTDADVRVYSNANQLLAEGKTGADGVWHLQRGEIWDKRENLAPHFVTVSKEHDVTFVRLTQGLLSKEVFDTSGRPWLTSGYDAAVFSARDIYRTGERAAFKAVVRSFDLSTPAPFPVLFIVRDPIGRTVRRNTALLSEEGGALLDFDIPENALTGVWTCSLFIPGDENKSIGVMNFNVEDFAPPRIEVKLSADAGEITSGSENAFNVSAKYLFGADGAGLRWEALWRAREGLFKPKNPRWASYTFKDDTRSFSPAAEDIVSDKRLNSEGEERFSFSVPDDWQGTVVDVTVTARVMEEGGRWVYNSLTLPYYPSPWLLGLAAPEGELAVGRELTFRAASLSPGEEPVDIDLIATFYRVTWNYNLVNVDGHTRWQSSEELSKIETKSLTTKDGVGNVTFKPESWGTYIVKISDEEDSASASIRFDAYSAEYAQRGSQLIDRVEIETDKMSYNVGDVAQITLRAPFKGLLLFNVEAFGFIDRRIIRVEGSETVIEMPITEQMTPNAWCAAWLIRPVVENETWGTHRAVGVKLVSIDTSESRLNVKLDVPEKIEPAARLPVTLTLSIPNGSVPDGSGPQGQPVRGEIALALVDDGVLGLTNFKTPDLVGHFLARRRMNSDGYDFYDQLMPLESRSTELLHPSGGALLEAFFGASGGQRFKILSIFDGMLSADETGVVKVELELPEFSGRGRVFAVASSGSRHGMAERTVQIARDVTTEADLPRFAAPGDVFTVPVTIFNSGEETKEVSVEVSATEELSIEGENAVTVSVPAKGSHSWNVAIKALVPGTAVYSVKTSWGDGKS
ncbi:MAG: MG2 domain-containing protein [Synergistaceae bacterium]|nr:MG2 domain-containing protein [Synergistaceae bacterium]